MENALDKELGEEIVDELESEIPLSQAIDFSLEANNAMLDWDIRSDEIEELAIIMLGILSEFPGYFISRPIKASVITFSDKSAAMLLKEEGFVVIA